VQLAQTVAEVWIEQLAIGAKQSEAWVFPVPLVTVVLPVQLVQVVAPAADQVFIGQAVQLADPAAE
jgi:hypothetical protein